MSNLMEGYPKALHKNDQSLLSFVLYLVSNEAGK